MKIGDVYLSANLGIVQVFIIYLKTLERICEWHLCRIAKTETNTYGSKISDMFEPEQIQDNLALPNLVLKKSRYIGIFYCIVFSFIYYVLPNFDLKYLAMFVLIFEVL